MKGLENNVQGNIAVGQALNLTLEMLKACNNGNAWNFDELSDALFKLTPEVLEKMLCLKQELFNNKPDVVKPVVKAGVAIVGCSDGSGFKSTQENIYD